MRRLGRICDSRGMVELMVQVAGNAEPKFAVLWGRVCGVL